MIRVPLPGVALDAPRLALPAEAAHYLLRVRRLNPGERVIAFDGRGGEVEAELCDDEAGPALRTLGTPKTGRTSAPLTLCYGLPKGDKLETVVRQCTELGVGRVLLLSTKRSVVQLDGPRAAKRRERLQRVAEEAARQSGRADAPTIEGPFSVADAAAATGDHALRLTLHPGAPALTAPLGVAPVALFVGPEGGFSPDELATLTAAGVPPVGLACPVLRTETAAVVACALVLHRMSML
ncbi:MAG: 16S rRNA (uracil(1498)-N(3))-methyltransferase [Myxococcales bacterium]|nr:16S rRNA (uracil(1498)-N(3))-methyltransferase [Myxococcales bacterium]